MSLSSGVSRLRTGWGAVPFGGWPEEQLQNRVRGIQLEQGADSTFHSTDAGFFDQLKPEKFSELAADGIGIETESLGGLAGGQGFGDLKQAQTLHADGRKRGPPWESGMAASQRKEGVRAWR